MLAKTLRNEKYSEQHTQCLNAILMFEVTYMDAAKRTNNKQHCTLTTPHVFIRSYAGRGSVSRARHVMVHGLTPSMLIFSP